MKRLRIAALALVLFCVPAIGADSAPPTPRPPVVAVGKVDLVEDVEVRRYTGHVTATAQVDLVARVAGELLRVNFHEGDMIDEGDVLYELDPVRYEAAVKSAEAKIEETLARISYTEINYERSEELYKNSALSKDNRDSAQSEYDASMAALLNAEAQLITAKDDLKNTRIIAPISGKIGTNHYTKGNYLTPSSGTIATIVQLDPLRVNFTMSNRDFLVMFKNEKGLKDNAEVQLILADGTVYPIPGDVEYIDNRVNPRTDTLQIYVSFRNPDHVLVPGSSLQVMLSNFGTAALPAVAPSAVMHDSKTAYVYVLDEKNQVERRNVRLGHATNDVQLIEDGVRPGETVIIDGTHKVSPGAVVSAKQAG